MKVQKILINKVLSIVKQFADRLQLVEGSEEEFL